MTEENRDEKEKSDRLLRRAFRWTYPMTEKMVTQRLVQANLSHNSTAIIVNTTIAANMVETQNQKVEGIDFELLRGIDRVNTSFNNVEILSLNQLKTEWKYCIPWSLNQTKKNYEKFIKPWKVRSEYNSNFIKKHLMPMKKIVHVSFTQKDETVGIFTPEEAKQKMKEWNKTRICPRCRYTLYGMGDRLELREATMVSESPEWSFFWEKTQCLTRNGYKILQGAFEAWAKTDCSRAAAILANLVSPNLYDSMMKKLSKDRTEEEEN